VLSLPKSHDMADAMHVLGAHITLTAVIGSKPRMPEAEQSIGRRQSNHSATHDGRSAGLWRGLASDRHLNLVPLMGAYVYTLLRILLHYFDRLPPQHLNVAGCGIAQLHHASIYLSIGCSAKLEV